MRKSQTTREQAREMGLLVTEAEWRIDTELFLNEYPRWSWELPTSPSSCTRCSYMLPTKGRKRQRGSSAKDAKAAYQDLT